MTASSPSRVYLLRHAKAAWAAPGERDFDRGLNEAGFAEAEVIADLAADRRYRPEVLLSSTAVRCRQTTEAWQRAFNEGIDIFYVDEMYNARSETYLSLVAAQTEAQSVMLVGHNPGIERLVALLVEGRSDDFRGMPPGGLAVLHLNGALEPGNARLDAFWSP